MDRIYQSDRGGNLFDELKKAHKDIRSLAGAQIAAIGQGTAKVLEDRGILVDLIPEVMMRITWRSTGSETSGRREDSSPRARKGNQEACKDLKEQGGTGQ